MEILGPRILEIAWHVALVLTALSAATLLAILFVRITAQQKIRHTSRFRAKAEPVVTAYLAGRAKEAGTVSALQTDPQEALLLLMELSGRLDPGARTRLHPLFASLPLAQAETAALKSRKWETRLQSAERLGFIGDPSGSGALLDALEDDILDVRFAAARSLAMLGDPAHIEPILLAFDVPGEMNQRRVAEVLHEFGPRAAAPLLAVVENRDGNYSDSLVDVAIRVLGMLRATEAVPALTVLLKSPEYRVRLNAVRALGQIGDRTPLAEIAALCDDPVWQVRNMAVQALGKLRGVQQIPILSKALADPAWWVRYSAGQALCALGEPGIDALRTAMTASSDRFAAEMSRQVLQEQRIIETKEKHP